MYIGQMHRPCASLYPCRASLLQLEDLFFIQIEKGSHYQVGAIAIVVGSQVPASQAADLGAYVKSITGFHFEALR